MDSASHFKKEKGGLILLFLTWFLFFIRTLSGRSTYFLDDLRIIFYPLEHVYAAAQTGGYLPVWSNLFGFGQPLVAWGQLGFFTPLHLVLRVFRLHPLTLLQLSILIYFALGLVGFYIFLRLLRLPTTSAALGALIFVFSGFSIGHLNHVNFYTGTMLLPWLLTTIFYFIAKPSLPATGLLAALAAAITLSAQPQIVLYCFFIAVTFGVMVSLKYTPQHRSEQWRYLVRVIGGVLTAGVVALCLSSFAILPLAEFLPLTERNGDLPIPELYEFSYPPSHAITLLLPYFFGDHESYWGAKGFQELAAYVGIIPLLLSGVALSSWRSWRGLRIYGLFLCIVGLLFALGQYSPFYRWLVEHHILTTLANPGRFVFFIDTGLAFLAAIGLHDIATAVARDPRRARWLSMTASVFVILILSPFAWGLRDPINTRSIDQLVTIATSFDSSLVLTVISWLTFMLTTWWPRRRFFVPTLLGLTAGTFILLGWNYNPLTPRAVAFAEPPFHLATASDSLPPRLYARPELLVDRATSNIIPTSTIGPDFSVYHPITPSNDNPCYRLPLYFSGRNSNTLQLTVHAALTGPPLATLPLSNNVAETTTAKEFCLPIAAQQTYYLFFSSTEITGLNLYHNSTPERLLTYFVRVQNPTPEQVVRSQKNVALVIDHRAPETLPEDTALLSRHLQVLSGASSARWIGALSIRPYREFIELFFANDRDEVVDGDGVHFLVKNRRFFDMAGVTHFTQIIQDPLDDTMSAAHFLVAEEHPLGSRRARLYTNPTTFPKAFLIPRALFIPADDEARATMLNQDFDPRIHAVVSGPKPPPAEAIVPELTTPLVSPSSATITHYTDTKVDVAVTIDHPHWLIVSDTTTPQWETFIDGHSAPAYTANTIFKAAWVPAGQHVVTWQYHSPAIAQAQGWSLLGLTALALLLLPLAWRWRPAKA